MYDDVKQAIKERPVYPPEGLTVDQLQAWLAGYAQCQSDVEDTINEMED